MRSYRIQHIGWTRERLGALSDRGPVYQAAVVLRNIPTSFEDSANLLSTSHKILVMTLTSWTCADRTHQSPWTRELLESIGPRTITQIGSVFLVLTGQGQNSSLWARTLHCTLRSVDLIIERAAKYHGTVLANVTDTGMGISLKENSRTVSVLYGGDGHSAGALRFLHRISDSASRSYAAGFPCIPALPTLACPAWVETTSRTEGLTSLVTRKRLAWSGVVLAISVFDPPQRKGSKSASLASLRPIDYLAFHGVDNNWSPDSIADPTLLMMGLRFAYTKTLEGSESRGKNERCPDVGFHDGFKRNVECYRPNLSWTGAPNMQNLAAHRSVIDTYHGDHHS